MPAELQPAIISATACTNCTTTRYKQLSAGKRNHVQTFLPVADAAAEAAEAACMHNAGFTV